MPETQYKSTPEDKRRAWLLGISYVALAVFLAVMLFKIWPPTPWPVDSVLLTNPRVAERYFSDCPLPTPSPSPQVRQSSTTVTQPESPSGGQASPTTSPQATATAEPNISPTTTPDNPQPSAQADTSPADIKPSDQAGTPVQTAGTASDEAFASLPINFFGVCRRTSFDERLILLVIIAGMLGSFVHAATSLADYLGNDNFNKNWTWFYLLRPAIGMSLALVFYFVVRGGFLTTSGGAKDINPYGIAALAGLVGMFSKQATDKLSEVFSTLFRSEQGDKQRAGSLKPTDSVSIKDVNPKSVSAGSTNQTITVTGTNFVAGAKVLADNVELTTTFVSATQLTALLDDASIAAPTTLKLKVVNLDTSESAEVDFPVT